MSREREKVEDNDARHDWKKHGNAMEGRDLTKDSGEEAVRRAMTR
jgi:hypothetical protein